MGVAESGGGLQARSFRAALLLFSVCGCAKTVASPSPEATNEPDQASSAAMHSAAKPDERPPASDRGDAGEPSGTGGRPGDGGTGGGGGRMSMPYMQAMQTPASAGRSSDGGVMMIGANVGDPDPDFDASVACTAVISNDAT